MIAQALRLHQTTVDRHISYGWMRKGEKKTVKTTGSRTRLNAIGRTVFQEYQTINDDNICHFFNEIRKSYPDYHQKIHLIVDGAGYNKAHLVKEWAYVSNIE